MTTANKVTIFRILLVPAFMVQLLYFYEGGVERDRILALVIFLVAAVLDGVDGYIARRYHQRSELGTVLDPLADKMLLLAAICLLSINKNAWVPLLGGEQGWIPTWLTAVVVSRDAILVLGLIVIYFAVGKLKVAPRFVGKVATVMQMVLVVWTLAKWDVNVMFWLALATAMVTAISGIVYVRDGMKLLSQSPMSLPEHHN